MATAGRNPFARSLRNSFTFARHVTDSVVPAPPAVWESASRPMLPARADQRYRLLLGVTLAALLVSLLDFALIIGAFPVPVPGLRLRDQNGPQETATYGFEDGTEGWLARDAAANAVGSGAHVFAGNGALEFQVTNLTTATKAFVYTPQPAKARPASLIVAHIYVPAGAPPLVGTIYALDGGWLWNSGTYPVLTPGTWTTISYQIPPQVKPPIREMGIMVVGAKGNPGYSGPIYLDSVDVQDTQNR